MAGQDTNLRLRGAIYYARIEVQGREISRSLRTGDRRVARARLKELLEEADRTRAGLKPRAEIKTWADAVIRFADLKYNGVKDSTAKRYKVSLRALDPHFATRPLAQLGQSDFSAYAAARIKAGVSQATVRRDLSAASLVMVVAKRAGWTKENGALEEMGEISERRAAIRPVPLRDLARVLRLMGPSFADMTRFAARTGCRQEEARTLRWGQIDFRRGTITFQQTKSGVPRVIEATAPTLRLLRRQERRPNTDQVFGPAKGRAFKNVSSRFRGVVSRGSKAIGCSQPGADPSVSFAGLAPFRFHDLRHTFCIRWLQRGGDAWGLARYVGHARFATTEGYIRFLVQGAGSKPGSVGRAKR